MGRFPLLAPFFLSVFSGIFFFSGILRQTSLDGLFPPQKKEKGGRNQFSKPLSGAQLRLAEVALSSLSFSLFLALPIVFLCVPLLGSSAYEMCFPGFKEASLLWPPPRLLILFDWIQRDRFY